MPGLNKQYIVYLILLVFLSSCTTKPKKVPPKPANASDIQLLKSAKKDVKARRTARAKSKLKKLLGGDPASDIIDDAHIELGDIYYAEDNYQLAYENYVSVVNSKIFSPIEAEAAYKAAKSLSKMGRFDEAIAVTDNLLDYNDVSSQSVLNIYKLRFFAFNQLGDRIDAVKSLLALSERESNPKRKTSYKLRAIDFVESQLDEPDLNKVASSSRFSDLRPYALFRLGKLNFDNKQFGDSRSRLTKVIDLVPDSELADRAQKIVDQIQARRKVSSKTIGVVLPLSGRHSKVAYRTLRGLQLGLGIYGGEKSNFKLAVIDSETNPDQARRAAERLVIEDHVIAIVGSLLSKTAVAVASKADELNVPNITLSQKSGLTEIGDNIFRSALTSQMQVRELVRTAMEDKGMKRFAVLYPNDRYGIEFTNLFWDEVRARGGEIVSAQIYSPKSTDFSGPIQRLVGTFYIDDRRSEYQKHLRSWYSKQKYINSRISPPDDLLPPVVDFDAIFIPDNVRAIGQIAPALAYHEVNDVALLGTNLWNSPGLLERAEQYVGNAIFVDGVLLTDEEFRRSKFYRDFYSTFNSYPTIFEAQAYDVGLLLRELILGGEQTRSGLQAALQQVKGFQGSLGELTMHKDRELSRNLVRLGVQDGKILRLENIKATAPLAPNQPKSTTN